MGFWPNVQYPACDAGLVAIQKGSGYPHNSYAGITSVGASCQAGWYYSMKGLALGYMMSFLSQQSTQHILTLYNLARWRVKTDVSVVKMFLEEKILTESFYKN